MSSDLHRRRTRVRRAAQAMLLGILALTAACESANQDTPESFLPPSVSVPDLVGEYPRSAKREVRAVGLQVQISSAYSSKSRGAVIRQVPAPGTEIVYGSVVRLVVARPIPTVPYIDFIAVRRARERLVARGHRVRVEYRKGGFIAEMAGAGTVIQHMPKRAKPGSRVTLIVAKPIDAPAPPTPSCSSHYTGACVPIASDVDCSGGDGNGPAYISGLVYVADYDIYDLDGDGDGVGCE